MMTRTGSLFRKRWPFLAAALVLAVAVVAGSMFAANSGDEPVQEAAAAQVQPDLTDPGLYANRQDPASPMAEPGESQVQVAPQAALPEPRRSGPEPGLNQVVPEGSGELTVWLSNPPPEMGFFSTQDAIVASDLDVAWMLYEAVATGAMTQDEADAFQAWFDERPTVDGAPDLFNHLPPEIQLHGQEGSSGSNNGPSKSR